MKNRLYIRYPKPLEAEIGEIKERQRRQRASQSFDWDGIAGILNFGKAEEQEDQQTMKKRHGIPPRSRQKKIDTGGAASERKPRSLPHLLFLRWCDYLKAIFGEEWTLVLPIIALLIFLAALR